MGATDIEAVAEAICEADELPSRNRTERRMILVRKESAAAISAYRRWLRDNGFVIRARSALAREG